MRPIPTHQTPMRRRSTTLANVLLTVAIVTSAVIVAAAAADDAGVSYEQSINDWHKGRIERLTSDDGYLSLVGLFPLEDGTHRFGSAPDNDVVFPDKAPSHAGTVVVDGSRVTVAPAASVAILHEGNAITRQLLVPDTEEDTTLLTMGTLTFYLIERGGRLYIRLKDRESETRRNFRGVERYTVSEQWRVKARFERYDPPRTIRIPNILGYDYVEQCIGVFIFNIDGKEYRLEPASTIGAEWFIVFGDETCGRETYGGGRFVYVPAPDESGITWIDFNKAYSPPCAFSPFATCPLPHKENMMAVSILAGEKNAEIEH